MDEFRKVMPLLWPFQLRECCKVDRARGASTFYPLPPMVGGRWMNENLKGRVSQDQNGPISCLLSKQERKLAVDFDAHRQASDCQHSDDYIHKWLVVNTRSFYYDLELKWKPRSNDDKLVLCPAVDIFNHSDHGVSKSTRD